MMTLLMKKLVMNNTTMKLSLIMMASLKVHVTVLRSDVH